jgi:hypothetical protein
MDKAVFIIDGKIPSTVKELKFMFKDNDLRLRIYLYMIEELKRRRSKCGHGFGLCFCGPDFIREVKDDILFTRLKVLPELWAMKPRNHKSMFGNYWFEERDVESRLNVLTNIVDKLAALK